MEITHFSSGEKGNELGNRIIDLVNEYSDKISGFEAIGVLEAVKQQAHDSIKSWDERDEEKDKGYDGKDVHGKYGGK